MMNLLILVAITCIISCASTFPNDINDPCRHGWHHFRDRCYMISTDRETWINAEFHCRVFGSHLAEIHDAETQEFLRNELRGLKHDYFIGLTDEAQTNVWEWVDTITTLNYTNWGPNQPDHQGHEEHCVFMLHDDAFEWHDVPCVDKNRFICESEQINVNIIG